MTSGAPITIEIREEQPRDASAVEALTIACFGPDRTRRTVYRFRRDIAPIAPLCLTAWRSGDPVVSGSLRFWPARLPSGESTLLLGPLAVRANLRGHGIGRTLIRHGLEIARPHAGGVLIIGDPGYYVSFGFTPAAVAGLILPGPVYPLTFMGLEFTPSALSRTPGLVTPASTAEARAIASALAQDHR